MSISSQQRREVYERAGGCCEYCRISEAARFATFEIDHIISHKHGGSDAARNLCLSCAPCNRHKGADVAAIDPLTGEATRLFNPRQQNWYEHFQINSDASLSGLSSEGRVAVLVLRLNEAPRIEQRFGERLLGNYPCQNKP